MLSIKILVQELWHDKSLMRIYLNRRLAQETLSGEVLDVGCGGNTQYLNFMPRTEGMHMHSVDPKIAAAIDFETESFPQKENTFDMVLVLNVLEHVFQYEHVLSEIHTVLKSGGTVIGFTPFLVRYHPDPHDYFRYTDEALMRILNMKGFVDVRVEPIGAGPFMAGLNIFVFSIPRPLRIVCALMAVCLDAVFIRMRPHAPRIYPMGYCFFAKK